MTDLLAPLASPDLRTIAVFAGAVGLGFVIGLAHFGTLWLNTRLWSAGRALQSAALQVARFALLTAGLAGLVQFGAVPLLGGAAGIAVARKVVVGRVRRLP